jgi:flavin-binding protein dodecin
MTVARVTEIKSSSPESFEHAVRTGVERAHKTLENVRGAWIQDQEVVVTDGKVSEFRVLMKVTFLLRD